MKFKVMFNRCIVTENFKAERTKANPDKTLWTKASANNWDRICTGDFCPGFCTRPTKNWGGSEMCDVLSGGQSVTGGGGSKLAKNSVTYFMDGPLVEREDPLLLSITFPTSSGHSDFVEDISTLQRENWSVLRLSHDDQHNTTCITHLVSRDVSSVFQGGNPNLAGKRIEAQYNYSYTYRIHIGLL